jgi:hypothetical protein
MASYYESENLKIDKDKLLNHVLNSLAEDKGARSDWETRKEKNHNAYFGILPEKVKPWPGCSNLNVPITQIVTDTYQANLMSSFFRKGDIVDVKPIHLDDIKTARKRKQFLNYQTTNEFDVHGKGLRPLADKIFNFSLIYGDAFTKERYVHIERNGKVIYDGIVVEVPNPDDIYKAANSIGTQSNTCAHIIQRTRITRSEYESLVKEANYIKIDFESYKPNKDNWDSFTLDSLGKDLVGISVDVCDSDNYITLLEYWGEFYNEKDKTVQELVGIIHPISRTLCKVFINDIDIRPFTQFSPRPIPNQPYGQGLPEILKYLQAEINTIHNQRRDSETKRICMPGFYDPGSDFDPQHYMLEPNGMYPVRGGSASIYFPNFQDAPSSLFSEEEMITRLTEQLTAASQPMQGVISKGEQSATEFAGVIDKSNIRFDLVFKRYEDQFKEMFDHIVILDQLYMPPEKEYRVVGHDGKFKWDSIAKQEMSGKLDLVITGASIASEIAERQAALTLYQAAMGNPLIQSDLGCVYENTRALYEAFGTKDIDRKVPIPSQSKTRTPTEEHEKLYQGIMIYPDPREDAQKHISEHLGEMSQKEFESEVPNEIQQMFSAHLKMTHALAASQNIMKNIGTMGMIGTPNIQAGSSTPASPVGGGAIQPQQPESPQQPKAA